jgi:hypothetical protein
LLQFGEFIQPVWAQLSKHEDIILVHFGLGQHYNVEQRLFLDIQLTAVIVAAASRVTRCHLDSFR